MRMNFALYALLVTGAIFAALGWVGFSLNAPYNPFQESLSVAELQAAWRECDASRRLAEWEMIETITEPNSEPSVGPTIHFKSDGTQFVYVENYADGRRSVTGFNPDYRFELEAASNSPLGLQRMFSTDEVNRLRETIPDALIPTEINMESFRRHEGLYFNLVIMWPELVSSSGFRILSSKRKSRDGTPVWEITFECTPNANELSHPEHPIPRVRNGYAVFYDKDKYFLPLEATFESMSKKSKTFAPPIQSRCEYEIGFGSIPQLREAVFRYPRDGGTFKEMRFDFKTISIGKSFNDEEFRLTAFGIPEPKGLELPSKGWPWWIKLSVAGIVAVGIAALFKLSINKGKK